MIHLYKRKGNRQAYDNHRGISLLSIARKIFARILLYRRTIHLDRDLVPECQCGFRKGLRTIDIVFAPKQLQGKKTKSSIVTCFQFHRPKYAILELAFEVSRKGLWKIMATYGCPQNWFTIVQQLYNGMQATVYDKSKLSGPFPVSNGVKRGCIFAPALFSVMFLAMLTDAFIETDTGINIRYRICGKRFNLKRLKSKTKVKYYTIKALTYADDYALNAGTQKNLQNNVNRFYATCSNFRLTINGENRSHIPIYSLEKMYVLRLLLE